MVERIRGELVSFASDDKVSLNGFLVRKRGKACLIYIHGMGSGFYRPLQLTLARELSGISLFAINTRGHDELTWLRKGKRQRQFLAGTGAERFEECVYDIGGAIRAMWRLGFRRFVLAGHSTGCQKVTYYQYKRKDRRVKALVLLAPSDDYYWHNRDLRAEGQVNMARRLARQGRRNVPMPELDYFSPRRKLSGSDLKNVEARLFNYKGKLSEFSKVRVPVCAAFGSEDQSVERDATEYLEILSQKAAAPQFRGIIVDGANHSFWEHETEIARAVSKWLNETVK